MRNAVELSLEERRRELATASALGASRREILGGVLVEGAVIGALGGVVGLGLGAFVAKTFVDSLSRQLQRATGLRVGLVVAPTALVIGVAVGVGVCVLASLGPGWRAARRDLSAELSERGRYAPSPHRGQPRLALTTAAFAAVVAAAWLGHRGGALEPWQPIVLWSSLGVGVLLSFRLPPRLVGPALEHLRGRRSFGTGPARVALDNLLSTPKRTASVAAAVGAPVVMAVLIGCIVPGIAASAHHLSEQESAGHVYVSTVGTSNTGGVDARVPPLLEQRIASLPGVAHLEHTYLAVLHHPATKAIELDGIDGTVPSYSVHRGVDGPTALAAGRVMIGTALARDAGLDVGSRFTVPGRYGNVALTVGGIWASPNGIGRGITTTADVMRTIAGPRPADRLEVVPARGVSPQKLATEIRSARLDPRLIVLDPGQRTRLQPRVRMDRVAVLGHATRDPARRARRHRVDAAAGSHPASA